MAVMGIKDNKCLFITLFLLALATETRGHRKYGYETRGYETRGYHSGKVQLFYLPEDAAKAKAFMKDFLPIQSRRRRLGRVSTTWLTAAAGDSETAEVALMKKLQDKMEQLESKLDTTVEAILEEKKTTEKNNADLQKVSTTWLIPAAGDSETAEVALMKKLQDKMEQLESKLDTTVDDILEMKKTTKKNNADLQKVSTAWLTAAAGDSETAEVALMKKLQEKMEQLEKKLQSKLDTVVEAIRGVKKTTEKNDAKPMDKTSVLDNSPPLSPPPGHMPVPVIKPRRPMARPHFRRRRFSGRRFTGRRHRVRL